MHDISFKQIANHAYSTDRKVLRVYRGVCQNTSDFVHTLVCSTLTERKYIDNRSKFYDKDRSTHNFKLFYSKRHQSSEVIHIFNFNIDLGSSHIDAAKTQMSFDTPNLLKAALIEVDTCAKYVVESLAANVFYAEDYKLLRFSRKQVIRRNISKPIFFTEDGLIDLDRYWQLILEHSQRNCKHEKNPDDDDRVSGIILD